MKVAFNLWIGRLGARSGSTAGTGGDNVTDQSAKMANSIQALRKTYTPVNLASVCRFDEARTVGARLLAEQKLSESVTSPTPVTL
jgi:hypothetical protein